MIDSQFAVGFSEHPLAAHAVGEAIGQIAERLAATPDVIIVFVSGEHLDDVSSIMLSTRAALRPRTLIGCTARGVIAGGVEAETGPAISMWAATGVDAESCRIEVLSARGGVIINGTESLAGAVGTLVLLSDPFSVAVDSLLEHLDAIAPDLRVVGGSASASALPGGNRLALDDTIISSGAVAVHFPDAAAVTPVVSQGCRPVGEPLIVTAAEANHIIELGGKPALERFRETVAGATPQDQELLHTGAQVGSLQVGIVFDESELQFGPGDFLIRGILGLDPHRGSVAINDLVEIGTTVQFQVRDPGSAEAELVSLLRERDARSVLSFNCTARGRSLFMAPNHDAEIIEDELGMPQVAGMFCAGEFGPVRGRNHLHTYTNALLLFR